MVEIHAYCSISIFLMLSEKSLMMDWLIRRNVLPDLYVVMIDLEKIENTTGERHLSSRMFNSTLSTIFWCHS